MESKTRRHFLGYLAGSVGTLAASSLFWMRRDDATRGPYRIVDRRSLPIGGLGLFVSVDKDLATGSLKAMGEKLSHEFRKQPNMVVNIFDDADAARIVKKGSRIVGEEQFKTAMDHQVASYIKDSRTGQHALTLHGPPKEVLHYRDA